MSDFYQRMQGVSSKLLEKFKQGDIVYRAPTAGAEPWEPVTYTDTPITGGTVSGVSQQYVTDLVTTSDLHAILPVFGTTPTNAGRLLIDGVERQIIRVMPSPAAGTVVCWHVFVKG